MYLFENIIGVFVFDDKISLVEKIMLDLGNDQKKEIIIDQLRKKYLDIKEPDPDTSRKILSFLGRKEFFGQFRERNLYLTRQDLRKSVNEDQFIINSIKSIAAIEKAANLLAKRVREWYELYNPEYSRHIADHEEYLKGIIEEDKASLLNKMKIAQEDSIGADLKDNDLEPVKELAKKLKGLYESRQNQAEYLSMLMSSYCPNVNEICGQIISAKLIEHAGTLKRLSELPASTIQILGAEKALFRHLKTGAKPPKHGVIIGHELIAKSPDRLHGKIARLLADKISIASKIDYFHGQYAGDKLRKEIEEKFSRIK